MRGKDGGYEEEPFVFPEGFAWGAATSSHQVEGDNRNSDWWRFETRGGTAHASGVACDQYRRFREDFALLGELGHNAHRLSLEWSRFEPKKGEWSEEAFQHYREVLQELHARGIKVCLTIHHFTNPAWLGAEGWERAETPALFARFAAKVAHEFDGLVDQWITINEPMVFLYMGWQMGRWPPAKKDASWFTVLRVFWHLVRAHRLAYRAIKVASRKGTPVGIAQNCQSYYAYDRHNIVAHLAVALIDFATNHAFYLFSRPATHDFLGVNYYFHHRVALRRWFRPEFIDQNEEQREKSDMGWELHPEGIFDVLLSLHSYRKPIFITECGVATDSEEIRQRFLVNVLKHVHHAIKAGVPVRGFFYWSFLDNFEWADGFAPHFGLVRMDYATGKREPRATAYLYRHIIRANAIDGPLFKYFGYRTAYDPRTDSVT